MPANRVPDAAKPTPATDGSGSGLVDRGRSRRRSAIEPSADPGATNDRSARNSSPWQYDWRRAAAGKTRPIADYPMRHENLPEANLAVSERTCDCASRRGLDLSVSGQRTERRGVERGFAGAWRV